MNIKIGINDVIRNFSGNFDEVYKLIQEEWSKSDLTTHIEYQTGSKKQIKSEVLKFADLTHTKIEDTEIKEGDIIYSELPQFLESGEFEEPTTLLNLDGKNDELALTKRFEFKSQEEYFYYLFSQYAFEIFGKAKLQYPDAITNLNEYIFLTKDIYNVAIFSQEIHNARPSTLHFLARERFVGHNILFYESLDKFWTNTDVAITTSPFILQTKPKGKITVKIETQYNMNEKADFSFSTFNKFLEYYKNNSK